MDFYEWIYGGRMNEDLIKECIHESVDEYFDSRINETKGTRFESLWLENKIKVKLWLLENKI